MLFQLNDAVDILARSGWSDEVVPGGLQRGRSSPVAPIFRRTWTGGKSSALYHIANVVLLSVVGCRSICWIIKITRFFCDSLFTNGIHLVHPIILAFSLLHYFSITDLVDNFYTSNEKNNNPIINLLARWFVGSWCCAACRRSTSTTGNETRSTGTTLAPVDRCNGSGRCDHWCL